MQRCINYNSAMKMAAHLRNYFESVWYGGRGAPILLLPFSWLFALLTGIRRSLYRVGILRRPLLPVPVIVVGNINVGGTGKTPVVVWLAQQLRSAGYSPGIVSRGYGAVNSRIARLVESEDATVYGDEPVLLSMLTECPVCIAADRVSAVERVAREGVNIVISDDGLQHYRMRRDAEIVVVDAERGFGNGQLMPAGPLRESVGRVALADAVAVNGSSSNIEGCSFDLIPADAVSLAAGARKPLPEFAVQRVWVVAGIGNPGRFARVLEAAGLQVDVTELPDHGTISLDDLVARRSQPIFMTQKDAVKYPDCVLAEVWYVPVEAVFSQADAEQLLNLAIRACD